MTQSDTFPSFYEWIVKRKTPNGAVARLIEKIQADASFPRQATLNSGLAYMAREWNVVGEADYTAWRRAYRGYVTERGREDQRRSRERLAVLRRHAPERCEA